MAKFVEKQNYGTKKYEALVKKPFAKFFALESILKFYKFTPSGSVKSSEIFYDTPTKILSKAGVVLSRIQENERVFFKVEQSAYNTATFKKTFSKIFVHQVGLKDTVSDHAFYLVDGIKALFSTPFSIDLENIIKNSIPQIAVFTTANITKIISGTGFRAYVATENTVYKNFETKRKYKSQGLTVTHLGPEQYLPEFEKFNKQILKYCKEFVEVNKNIYEHALKVTKKIEPLTKEQKEELKRKKRED